MAEQKIDPVLLAEIAEARRRGSAAARTEPRARAAHYDRVNGHIVVELTDGCIFAFPAKYGQGLKGATPEELAGVEILPGGSGLRWEALDADLSVPGLVARVFGSDTWMAQQLGRRGGSATSEAKARAARANGVKGGRPRKNSAPVAQDGRRKEPAGRRKSSDPK